MYFKKIDSLKNNFYKRLFNSERGTGFIFVLWLVAVVGVVVGAFTLRSISQTRITDSLGRLGTSESLARSGIQTWMAQLRTHADMADDNGVIITEIMNYFPGKPSPISISEIDPGGRCGDDEYIAIYNRSERSINITGWLVQAYTTTTGSPVEFAEVTEEIELAPRESYVLAGTNFTNSGDTAELLTPNGYVMDYVRWNNEHGDEGESYKVFPDGGNGFKPAHNRQVDGDAGWQQIDCSINRDFGDTDAQGTWLTVGDGIYEGVKVRQLDKTLNVVSSHSFSGTPDFEQHFLKVDQNRGAGFLTVTNNIDPADLLDIYPEGAPSSDTHLIFNSEGNFPVYSDTTMYVEISVPQPRFGNVTWDTWAYTDRNANPGDNLTMADQYPEYTGDEYEYLVRIDTPVGTDSLLRGDSVSINPDPGNWQPPQYTGNSADYVFVTSEEATGKFYVSELYDTGAGEVTGPDHLVITKVRKPGTEWWIEVFNPTNEPRALCHVDRYNWNERVEYLIPPGEYYYVARDGHLFGLPNYHEAGSRALSQLEDGLKISEPPNDVGDVDDCQHQMGNNEKVDIVGWYREDRDPGDVHAGYYLGDPVEHTTTWVSIRRKVYGGVPVIPNDNSEDWEDLGDQEPDFGGYEGTVGPDNQFAEFLLYGQPFMPGGEAQSFVEIYNDGSEVDIIAEGYQLEDSLDEDGEPVSGNLYNIVLHELDPHYDGGAGDGVLEREQVGLIVDDNFDSVALGVDNLINEGIIRIFTLGSEFLTGGLHDKKMEHLTLHRPDEDENVVVLQEDWDPDHVVPFYSREKVFWQGSEINQNWDVDLTNFGGSPGFVPPVVDHYGAPWGWAAEHGLFEDVEMHSKVFLPDLASSYSSGDFGYFQIKRIESEGGKHSLQLPPDTFSLRLETNPTSYTRQCSLESDQPIEQIMYPDNFVIPWLSSYELRRLDQVGHLQARGYGAYLSPYRRVDRRININTAIYEALRGIRINSDPDHYNSSDYHAFLTEPMARVLIENRLVTDNFDAEDLQTSCGARLAEPYFEEISPQAFSEGSNPYETLDEACEDLEATQTASSNFDFDCDTFKQYATLGGDNVYKIEVEGVRIRESSENAGEYEKLGSTRLEAVVKIEDSKEEYPPEDRRQVRIIQINKLPALPVEEQN